MSLFKSETLGEKLDREAKEKAKLRSKIKQEKIGWGVGDIKPENQTQVLIEQNECIIQLLSILCTGQNNISGTASVAVRDMYQQRLDKLR